MAPSLARGSAARSLSDAQGCSALANRMTGSAESRATGWKSRPAEGRLSPEQGIDRRQRDGEGARHQHRVAVGRRGLDAMRGDGAGRAGLVLHHHRLADVLLQHRRQCAGGQIERAARRERHHQRDLTCRVVLRGGREDAYKSQQELADRGPADRHGNSLPAPTWRDCSKLRREIEADSHAGLRTQPLFSRDLTRSRLALAHCRCHDQGARS